MKQPAACTVTAGFRLPETCIALAARCNDDLADTSQYDAMMVAFICVVVTMIYDDDDDDKMIDMVMVLVLVVVALMA